MRKLGKNAKLVIWCLKMAPFVTMVMTWPFYMLYYKINVQTIGLKVSPWLGWSIMSFVVIMAVYYGLKFFIKEIKYFVLEVFKK